MDVTYVNKQRESNTDHPSEFPGLPVWHTPMTMAIAKKVSTKAPASSHSVRGTYGATVNDAKEWGRVLTEVKRIDRLLLLTRVCAILCAIGIIVSSSFFINEGIFKLGSTLNAGIKGMWQVNRVAQSAIDVIYIVEEEWVECPPSGISKLNDTVSVYGWCPLKRDELIEACSATRDQNVSIPTLSLECNVTDIPFQRGMVALLDIFGSISLASNKNSMRISVGSA
jgi:hypothetical protein